MLFDAHDVVRRLDPGLGRDVTFTILHAGEAERIDHVLVSEEFVPQSKHAIGHVAAVEVLADHVFERRRSSRAGGADPNEADLSRIFSDHAAVCVSIVIDGHP
jgi:endonuclease/exonuclease/phosphatase family metal-dependent hydrolase